MTEDPDELLARDALLYRQLGAVEQEIEALYASRDEEGMSSEQYRRYRQLLETEAKLRSALGLATRQTPNREDRPID